MVGGSLRVLQLLPPLKLVVMIDEILLKEALNTINQSTKFMNPNIDSTERPIVHLQVLLECWYI
jgi:hypothetical protein